MAIRRLSEFVQLGKLPLAEFTAQVPYPVLVMSATSEVLDGQDRPEETATRTRLADGALERMVIAFEPRPGSSGAVILVGRGPSSDVVLPFETISRTHAQISRVGRDLVVTDQRSKNGSWLNGERLEPLKPYVAKDGDRLKMGDLEGVVLLPGSFYQTVREH